MTTPTIEDFLVAGRECGECTVCCISLTINTPEIVKLPNVPCENLTASGGCGIYNSRPDICGKMFCAWRSIADLGDEWRPDKMGVLLEYSEENFPGEFAGKIGFRITILDKEKVINNNAVAAFVAYQVANGTPCIISYGIEPSELLSTGFLNYALGNVVRENRVNAIHNEIKNAIEACEKQPKYYLKIEDGKLVEYPSSQDN